MIKEFMYTSNSGTRNRKIFVIKENDSYIEGLDLSMLSNEDVTFITNTYKDFKPLQNRSDKIVLEGFNPSWNKAYRQFSKSKILNH